MGRSSINRAPTREDAKRMGVPGRLLEEASNRSPEERKIIMLGEMFGLEYKAPAVWKHHFTRRSRYGGLWDFV